MSPTSYISAFLPPRVNAGDVRILCNCGEIPLQGSVALMRQLARDILKAIDGPQAVVFQGQETVKPKRVAKLFVPSQISVDREVYRTIRAEVEAPGFSGYIRDVCGKHGIDPRRFMSWRSVQRRHERAAQKQEAVPTVVPFSSPGVGATLLPNQSVAQ